VTQPRQIIAGRIYLLSRRCTQRTFLLRPDPEVEQIYLYCLAEAAERFDITLYGWVAMSNHHHVLAGDEKGRLPEFLAHFHKMIAKAMNARLERWENFWATEQPNAVWLVRQEDCFDKLLYVLLNPVADHLVERVEDWPGAHALSLLLSGKTMEIRRPRGFFRQYGPMPSKVMLRAARLPQFAQLTQAAWAEKLVKAIRAGEKTARDERLQAGRGVVGRKNVLRTKPTDRPNTVEPRRGLRPLLACKDEPRRIEELALVRAFRAAYRRARAAWCKGKRRTLFPAGTYAMRVFRICCREDLLPNPALA
jgi:putative transposase